VKGRGPHKGEKSFGGWLDEEGKGGPRLYVELVQLKRELRSGEGCRSNKEKCETWQIEKNGMEVTRAEKKNDGSDRGIVMGKKSGLWGGLEQPQVEG